MRALKLILLLGLAVWGISFMSCNSKDKGATLQGCIYVGSIRSDKYHLPECEWARKIKPDNQICFKDKEEAREQGYVPCKVCKP